MGEPIVHSGEHLVVITDEHWIKFVGPVLLFVLLLGVSLLLFYFAGLSAHHTMWLSHGTLLIAMFVFLMTHHWFFMVLLSEAMDRIIVTNRRLFRMKYRLLFTEDILEISFEKMKTVDATKTGILQNLLRYGTLSFETKLASISLIPHPNKLAQIIQKAMRDEQ